MAEFSSCRSPSLSSLSNSSSQASRLGIVIPKAKLADLLATKPGSRLVPERGDVVWLAFDPQAGHEQAGRRPAVVLSPSIYNRKAGLAVFAPVTNQFVAHPAHVEGCELRFVDDDHLVVRFTFTGGEKKSVENIELKRVR